MRLSKRILQRLDADRVRRINEIYHNLENTGYDRLHEDIPQFEGRFWKDAAARHVNRNAPVVWLDYGTGTGFVPLAIAEHLKARRHPDLLRRLQRDARRVRGEAQGQIPAMPVSLREDRGHDHPGFVRFRGHHLRQFGAAPHVRPGGLRRRMRAGAQAGWTADRGP